MGATAALLVSCGSGKGLIPGGNAQQLTQRLQDVADAVAAGDCTTAIAAGARVVAAIDDLPSSVDRRLVLRLRSGARKLNDQIPNDCVAPATHKRPVTPTTTTKTKTTPTTTQTQTATQTETIPTIPTIETSTETTTTPGTSGGVTAP